MLVLLDKTIYEIENPQKTMDSVKKENELEVIETDNFFLVGEDLKSSSAWIEGLDKEGLGVSHVLRKAVKEGNFEPFDIFDQMAEDFSGGAKFLFFIEKHRRHNLGVQFMIASIHSGRLSIHKVGSGDSTHPNGRYDHIFKGYAITKHLMDTYKKSKNPDVDLLEDFYNDMNGKLRGVGRPIAYCKFNVDCSSGKNAEISIELEMIPAAKK